MCLPSMPGAKKNSCTNLSDAFQKVQNLPETEFCNKPGVKTL